MNVSRENKKVEAVKRMKKFGIFEQTISQFEKEDLVSESAPPLGACFWLDDEQKQRVKEFEEKYNALVYHCVHSYTELGEMECYLFVSDYEEEWEMDNEDIDYMTPIAYVYVKDTPEFSEIGSIAVKLTPAAGLKRIG